jgi:inner membrane protein involved in colicin E2 resistance
MIFLLSTYLFFWLYIFLIPSPKLIIDTAITAPANTYEEQTLNKAINLVKNDNKENLYYFEKNIESKKSDATFLYGLVAFALIFFIIVILHWKSHIMFPLIASALASLLLVSVLWMFTDTIDKSLYIDIQNTRAAYKGFRALEYVGIFLFLDVFCIIFGIWYDLD